MAIVKWDPFRELEEMSDRLNRMIARPSINSGGGAGKRSHDSRRLDPHRGYQ